MLPVRQMVPPPGPLSLPKILVVEGDTPMHFCEALLRHLGREQEIEIRNFGGVSNLGKYLAALAIAPEFQRVVSLGIVRDAENQSATSAQKSVTAACTAAGLSAPRHSALQVSVFIFPDNRNPGMIETLCMQAVTSEPALAGASRCVADFFGCLQAIGATLPTGPALAKNQAQAYLSTRPKSQMFPGVAAYHGHWPWANPVFQPLIQFLQAM